ncbi:MAG: DNA cytosine methyltransferase [Geminicoccaceae bacterium]
MAVLSILDIAAGTGMLSVGVKLALESIGLRADVVGGCERDACAAAAFLEVMEHAQGFRPPVWDDARTFVGRRDRGLESVDFLTAGYPCQPFSTAGNRAGGRDPRHLWPAIRRIVARIKPGIVFFENVDGHISLGLGKVLRDLERLGYSATCGVFSAEEVGAPHLRKRVFVLGLSDTDQQRWAKGQAEQPLRQGRRKAVGRVCELDDAELSGIRSESGRNW